MTRKNMIEIHTLSNGNDSTDNDSNDCRFGEEAATADDDAGRTDGDGDTQESHDNH